MLIVRLDLDWLRNHAIEINDALLVESINYGHLETTTWLLNNKRIDWLRIYAKYNIMEYNTVAKSIIKDIVDATHSIELLELLLKYQMPTSGITWLYAARSEKIALCELLLKYSVPMDDKFLACQMRREASDELKQWFRDVLDKDPRYKLPDL